MITRGWVDSQKSDFGAVPCPVYALESPGCRISKCDRWLRAVVAACGHENRLITVIDLKEDHVCWCD